MKLITWTEFGDPGTYHLIEAYKGTGRHAPRDPLCGQMLEEATVRRPDGNFYCRFCVGLEGVLPAKRRVNG